MEDKEGMGTPPNRKLLKKRRKKIGDVGEEEDQAFGA